MAGRHAKGLRLRRAQQAATHLDLCGPHAQPPWKSPGVGPPRRTSQAFPRQAQGHTCPPTPQGRAPGHPPEPCRNGKLWHPGVWSACRAKRPSPPFPWGTANIPALGLGGRISSTCSTGLLGLYVCLHAQSKRLCSVALTTGSCASRWDDAREDCAVLGRTVRYTAGAGEDEAGVWPSAETPSSAGRKARERGGPWSGRSGDQRQDSAHVPSGARLAEVCAQGRGGAASSRRWLRGPGPRAGALS